MIGFSTGGAFTPLAVTDRVVADPPAFGVALAHVWPSPATTEAAAVAERALAALGIGEGPSYVQVRVGPDGARVIEVAARLGGGHDAELVERATGVPLNDLAIDAALGRRHRAAPSRPTRRWGGDAVPRRPARGARGGGGARTTSRGSSESGSIASPGSSFGRSGAAPTGPARCSPSATAGSRRSIAPIALPARSSFGSMLAPRRLPRGLMWNWRSAFHMKPLA